MCLLSKLSVFISGVVCVDNCPLLVIYMRSFLSTLRVDVLRVRICLDICELYVVYVF